MATLTTVYGFTKPAQGDTPWTTQANGDYDSIDSELARPRWPFNSPVVGATTTLDLSLARTFVFTVSQATTLAFTNVPTSSFTTRVVCLITNGSAFVVSFPASVVWLGGAGPALRASGVDVLELITRDGGTTWYASKMASNPLIYQNQGLSTASAAEVSLASFSVPAGMLATNGQSLRYTLNGLVSTQNATALKVVFGATTLVNFSPASGKAFYITGTLTRTGAATQLAMGFYCDNSVTSAAITGRTTPAETLANAILLDFRGSITAGGTLFFDSIEVEFLGR